MAEAEAMNEELVIARDDLIGWLDGKPKDWGQVIAARAALRALPCLSDATLGWIQGSAITTLRALSFAWADCNTPTPRFSADYLAAAVEAADFAARNAKKESLRTVLTSDAAYCAALSALSGSTRNVAQAVKSSAEAIADWVYQENTEFTLLNTEKENAPRAYRVTWASAADDFHWLAQESLPKAAARRLTRQKLWPEGYAEDWKSDWDLLGSFLLAFDPNYSVWIDWYERRIRGERAAFDIPGDKGRIEDKKILRRLAEATDKDFWGKGHEYVNATLKGWLDEARERSAKNLETLAELEKLLAKPESLDSINPDPQDMRSPQFGSDATGRIAIRPGAGADQLRADIQSLSRHARALQMAQRLAEALRNHNNAGYMTEMASDYVAAMESEQNGPDPSGLVFAGDQLREAIAKHRAAEADDDLQPLPPSADRDASAFLSAHNMYVGSDPFLDDLDRTTRGPDAPLPAANPDEIRRVATIARHDDILAEQTYEYIVAASEAAPANFDPADRHSRFVAGLAQNFARYGIEFLWSYPNEAAWAGLTAGAVVTVALGPLAAAGGTIAGIGIAYHMARNMIANEAIYEKLLATSPAGEDNFNRLMRFLKSLPIKSLKDD